MITWWYPVSRNDMYVQFSSTSNRAFTTNTWIVSWNYHHTTPCHLIGPTPVWKRRYHIRRNHSLVQGGAHSRRTRHLGSRSNRASCKLPWPISDIKSMEACIYSTDSWVGQHVTTGIVDSLHLIMIASRPLVCWKLLDNSLASINVRSSVKDTKWSALTRVLCASQRPMGSKHCYGEVIEHCSAGTEHWPVGVDQWFDLADRCYLLAADQCGIGA